MNNFGSFECKLYQFVFLFQAYFHKALNLIVNVCHLFLDCAGVNGRLVYSISGGDEKDQFIISANGIIYTKAPLDREDQSFYNLVIRASDMAHNPNDILSSTVQVSLNLNLCPLNSDQLSFQMM